MNFLDHGGPKREELVEALNKGEAITIDVFGLDKAKINSQRTLFGKVAASVVKRFPDRVYTAQCVKDKLHLVRLK
jgi:hypothetical protein